MHVDSVCDLPVQMRQDGDSKLTMDLFRPKEKNDYSPNKKH